MGLEVTDLVVIVVAIAAGAFVKGLTGGGLPMVAIPMAAIFLGVERAVVLLVVPGVVGNAWMVWTLRSHLRETRDLPTLLATGAVGAVAGAWLLKELDGRILSAVLAALIVAYVTLRLSRPDIALSPRTTRLLSPPVGLAAGTLQGATGISGPIVTTYLHGYRLEPPVFVLSIVVLFQVFAAVQGVSLFALGLLTPSRLFESSLALIPMAIALPLGARLRWRLSSKRFDTLVLGLLVVSAVTLVRNALTGS